MSPAGSFWVGVQRLKMPYGTVARGPMFVHWERPAQADDRPPIVLVHGGGGQGTDYLVTPDGRPGWATLLVERGWTVYVVDRPGHGRSPYHPDVLGAMTPPPTFERLRALFVAGETTHPQWPGTGLDDDPVLAQLVAAGGPMPTDWAAMHTLEQERMVELLERVGPAVVIAHSAGGPAGFLAADARPELVRALVALEPIGPPFLELPPLGTSLAWGVAAAPLTVDPADRSAAELRAGAPTTLPRLAQVPIAVVSAECSGLRDTDAQTVAFLAAGGCAVEHLALADHGVHGNGHGLPFERNHAAVLDVVLRWIGTATATDAR